MRLSCVHTKRKYEELSPAALLNFSVSSNKLVSFFPTFPPSNAADKPRACISLERVTYCLRQTRDVVMWSDTQTRVFVVA